MADSPRTGSSRRYRAGSRDRRPLRKSSLAAVKPSASRSSSPSAKGRLQRAHAAEARWVRQDEDEEEPLLLPLPLPGSATSGVEW